VRLAATVAACLQAPAWCLLLWLVPLLLIQLAEAAGEVEVEELEAASLALLLPQLACRVVAVVVAAVGAHLHLESVRGGVAGAAAEEEGCCGPLGGARLLAAVGVAVALAAALCSEH
jgi:hypothetical protein